jgi:hypothetical protein
MMFQTEEEVHLDQGDYSTVQPSDHILYLDPNLNVKVDEGCINVNSKPANAILNFRVSLECH